jgi:hypothetical protein
LVRHTSPSSSLFSQSHARCLTKRNYITKHTRGLNCLKAGIINQVSGSEGKGCEAGVRSRTTPANSGNNSFYNILSNSSKHISYELMTLHLQIFKSTYRPSLEHDCLTFRMRSHIFPAFLSHTQFTKHRFYAFFGTNGKIKVHRPSRAAEHAAFSRWELKHLACRLYNRGFGGKRVVTLQVATRERLEHLQLPPTSVLQHFRQPRGPEVLSAASLPRPATAPSVSPAGAGPSNGGRLRGGLRGRNAH